MRQEAEDERIERCLNDAILFHDAIDEACISDMVYLISAMQKVYLSVDDPGESNLPSRDEAIEDLKQAMESIARNYGE